MGRSFTKEEIEVLREYYRENAKNLELTYLSEKLNRSRSTLCRKARELGLTDLHTKPQRMIENRTKILNEYNARPEMKEIKSNAMRKRHEENGHPRGMLGKTHSEEYKKQLSTRVKNDWINKTEAQRKVMYEKQTQSKIKNGTLNPNTNKENPYSRANGGKRADLNNVYFRSSWEANIARYYNFVGIEWQFEPKIFVFEKIKKGCVSYTPDFYLPKEDRWVEVKGWMDDKSKTKLKRFEKYYPNEYKRLEIITGKEYKEFAKYKTLIPNWEG